MKLFYCRVSTTEQREDRQIKLAEQLGIEQENIFIDKQSGKDTKRKELQRMIDFSRKGDTIYVESISRLARNTRDLLEIVEILKNKNVEFVSQKENIDTTTPQGRFMLTIFGAMAEIEREYILQRQAEGIEIAKSKGVYKGRQKMNIDEKEFERMCAEWRKGERTAVSIQRRFNITATTFYRWVKERNL